MPAVLHHDPGSGPKWKHRYGIVPLNLGEINLVKVIDEILDIDEIILDFTLALLAPTSLSVS